jgi:hypothetical protein
LEGLEYVYSAFEWEISAEIRDLGICCGSIGNRSIHLQSLGLYKRFKIKLDILPEVW